MYDISNGSTKQAILKQVAKIEQRQEKEFRLAHVEDMMIGNHRICVTVYDDILTLNSNSLKVIRSFAKKIFNEGHILICNKDLNKSHIDTYKYFKAFNIIKINMPICLS